MRVLGPKNFQWHPLGSVALATALTATVLLHLAEAAVGTSSGPSLSRHKRYVVFPEGSTFTVAQCLTFTATTGNDIWTEGLNWAVSYDLPNETRYDRYPLDGLLPPPLLQRRHRRDLYSKLELLLEASGTNGRACVLRTLCDAAQRFLPGGSMLEEMLKAVFTVPLSRVLSWEPPEHAEYTAARRAGVHGHRCADLYPTCPVSLLDLALGAFSTRGNDVDAEDGVSSNGGEDSVDDGDNPHHPDSSNEYGANGVEDTVNTARDGGGYVEKVGVPSGAGDRGSYTSIRDVNDVDSVVDDWAVRGM